MHHIWKALNGIEIFFLAHVEFSKVEFNILQDFLNDNSQRCDVSKINKNFNLCSGNSNSANDSSDKKSRKSMNKIFFLFSYRPHTVD